MTRVRWRRDRGFTGCGRGEQGELNFGCRLRNQRGVGILEGETRHVCATIEEKPRRLPPELVAALAPYLHPVSGG